MNPKPDRRAGRWIALIVPPEFHKSPVTAIYEMSRFLEESGKLVYGLGEWSCILELCRLNNLPPPPRTHVEWVSWRLRA